MTDLRAEYIRVGLIVPGAAFDPDRLEPLRLPHGRCVLRLDERGRRIGQERAAGGRGHRYAPTGWIAGLP